MLEIYNRNGTRIATNNKWKDTQQDAIKESGIPPKKDMESAVIRVVPPDSYTAIVRGVNAATGVALIEVYALPPEQN